MAIAPQESAKMDLADTQNLIMFQRIKLVFFSTGLQGRLSCLTLLDNYV